ncbi:MAG: DUF2480 family protein [Flavobacteriales bacterium]|jgi:hypothetical protein|nr:DUF2480 family protein [Flavobacteriales bacterium]
MAEANEIRNKVAESTLITFNLEDLYQVGERKSFDLKDFLFEGLILREKDYRQALKDFDWTVYRDAFVNIQCSADAIVPQWAFMLAATYLQPVAKRVVMGNLETLETVLYQEALAGIELEQFRDERVIVKGCSKYPVPTSAYVEFVSRLLPISKAVMYGEACSTVPLFKR